jgi:uncharacterized membrane protein YeiH
LSQRLGGGEDVSAFIHWFGIAESIGIFSLGVNAAMLAQARGYSALGIVLVTAASAMGGSTVRDILLGPEAQPFVWARSPALLLTTLTFAYLFALLHPVQKLISKRDYWIKETAEALAFASLTALGAAKATTLLAPVVEPNAWGWIALPLLAAVIGMIGSTAGLILRDVLLGRSPVVVEKGAGTLEPVLAAALAVAILIAAGVAQPIAVLAGFLIALMMRGMRIWRNRPVRAGALA